MKSYKFLLYAISSVNLGQFFRSDKAGQDITNLFIAANKIEQISLINAAKDWIFACFSREDFEYFKTKNSHPSVQTLLDNFENEILAFSKRKPVTLKNYISCLNFDEIKHSKLLDFNIYKIKNASPQNNKNYKISSKMSEIDGKTIVRILILLKQCAYKIEKISIPHIALSELDQVFKHLKTNPYLKSIKARLSNLFHPNPQSPSYHIRLEQLDALLDLIKHTKSLVNVDIKAVRYEEKALQAIKDHVAANVYYNNLFLLFCARKYDAKSSLQILPEECVNHMVKMTAP